MHKRKSLLWLGLSGSLLGTAAGLLGAIRDIPELSNWMAVLSSFRSIPVWRICLCTSLGCLGFLLQYFGYQGIYRGFEDRENKKGRLFSFSNWCFTVGGAVFHVLAFVFVLFYPCLMGQPKGEGILLQYLLFCAAPFFIISFLGYLMVCILLFIQLSGGRSCFPRWLALFNPLLVSVLLNTFVFFLPGYPILNGIPFAGAGISSMVLFTVLLLSDRHR